MSAPTAATEPRNREVLLAYADAKGRHDVDAALGLCHPDYVYETAGLPGRIEGLEAARAFYGQLFEVLPDYYGDFDGMTVDGDSGVAWGRFGGTSELTGRRIDMPVAFVCTFKDGLLLTDTGYFDSRTFYELLGVPHPVDADATAFVERFQDAWRRRELDGLMDVLTDVVDAYFPGMPAPCGKDQVRDWMRAALAATPDVRLEVQRWARAGDSVLIEWEASATVGSEPLTWGGCDRFTLRGDRGHVERVYFDSAPLTEALARGAAATPSG
jgi:ketosteroid isomerase-like protein